MSIRSQDLFPQGADPPPPSSSSPSARDRTRRQAGLFFGGVAFVVLSSLVTRRSLRRRYAAVAQLHSATISPLSKGHGTLVSTNATAPGYTSAAAEVGSNTAGADSVAAAAQANGWLLAFEALTVATMNVCSWAFMLTGGALWALDISTMDDLRRKVRGGLGVDGSGRTEQEVEEEMEEWLVSVMTRKEDRERLMRERGEKEGKRVNERGKER